MHQAIADLHSELERRDAVTAEAVGTAIGEHGDKIIDRAEKFAMDLQREFLTLVEKQLAELAARFDVVLPEARARATTDFKFSSERDDAEIDLPNPLTPRGVIRKTTIN